MANLAALAWVSAKDKNPWQHLLRKFRPDGGKAPQAPVERWYMAAMHAASADEMKDWRQRTIEEAIAFNHAKDYVNRPAVAALAILEGSSWLPSIANAGNAAQVGGVKSGVALASSLMSNSAND